jgi:hypothetical protein
LFLVSDRERSEQPEEAISVEAVGTLVWLLDGKNLDRRRYAVLNRLRKVRESDQFEALPDALRERVREILEVER